MLFAAPGTTAFISIGAAPKMTTEDAGTESGSDAGYCALEDYVHGDRVLGCETAPILELRGGHCVVIRGRCYSGIAFAEGGAALLWECPLLLEPRAMVDPGNLQHDNLITSAAPSKSKAKDKSSLPRWRCGCGQVCIVPSTYALLGEHVDHPLPRPPLPGG